MDGRVVRSPRLPGGDLVAAVLDRDVMGLADRGGASGLIGSRWGDLCAARVATWEGTQRPVPGHKGEHFAVTRVVRLDATPEIAAVASKRGLQNPDLLLFGRLSDREVVQAADAKFSVETARSKQVSTAVVAGLLQAGEPIASALGEVGPEVELLPGVFLSPDFLLTRLMLHRRQGIVRVTVRPDEVVMLPVAAAEFFAPLPGSHIIVPLAALDALPVKLDESLMASLYYFRLARAAVGCWLDATKPLLLFNDRPTEDDAAVLAEVERRATRAASAWDLILAWNADVDTVRAQRAAVDQVAALPIMGRDLRALVTEMAAAADVEPPSLNQVRRRLGAWYRAQLRERVGPLPPPVPNLGETLQTLGRVGAALTPALHAEAHRLITEMLEQRAAEGKTAASALPPRVGPS